MERTVNLYVIKHLVNSIKVKSSYHLTTDSPHELARQPAIRIVTSDIDDKVYVMKNSIISFSPIESKKMTMDKMNEVLRKLHKDEYDTMVEEATD